jgi:hypothetical protein
VRTAILGPALCAVGYVVQWREMLSVSLIGGGLSLMGSSILVDLRGWAQFNVDVFGSIIRMYSDFQTSRAIMALMGVMVAAGGAIAIGYVFFPWGKPWLLPGDLSFVRTPACLIALMLAAGLLVAFVVEFVPKCESFDRIKGLVPAERDCTNAPRWGCCSLSLASCWLLLLSG